MAIIYQYPIVDVNTSDFFLVSKQNNSNKTANVRILDVINKIPTVLELNDFNLYGEPFGNPGATPQPGDTINYDGTEWVQGPPGTAKVEIINVSATTIANNYEATVASISGLDQDVVYKTTFDATNTISPVTLNINGYGATNIQRGTLNGFEDIPIDFIIPGVEYFLTWNGNIFQINTSNPVSGASSEFINPEAVTQTIGGITVGTTFQAKVDGSGYTLQEMFDLLLYPYQLPILSGLNITGQGPTVEVGYTVPAGPATFNWSRTNEGNIDPTSGAIADITDSASLTSGIDISALTSVPVTLPNDIVYSSPSTHKWEITGLNSQGGTISPSIYTITWKWKWFWGTNALEFIGAGDIANLGNSALASSSSGSNTWAAGDYKYLVMPDSFPEPSVIKDSSTNLGVGMAGVSEGYNQGTGTYKYLTVTSSAPNTYGESTTYRIYRTKNALGGAVSFIIS